ncbi:hypothetical protein [Rhodoferax mekongensis]|uniref:Uncharacterized protein n=1 Tax=Rhodoferax mekongensis TaxID=3068341 RepID=A0ABZ0AWU2_9BURK|nr:hypothetical protein [Rhodoferax sp. TBRC 17307]WNO03927.1 hypothetical protein RAN89_13530 [Rhodoferax sp. TBRC 17307]
MLDSHLEEIAEARVESAEYLDFFDKPEYLVTESFESGELTLDFTAMSPSFLWSLLGILTKKEVVTHAEVTALIGLMPTPMTVIPTGTTPDPFFQVRNLVADCDGLLSALEARRSVTTVSHYSKAREAMKRLQGTVLVV